ncbi:MAG: hypothetical protein ACW97A_14200 [Candidatus Thorarchaeota archaeon]|jgi:hypothetical protein
MSWKTQTLSSACQNAISTNYIGKLDIYINLLGDSQGIMEKKEDTRQKLRYMSWVTLLVPIFIGIFSAYLAVYIIQDLSVALINVFDAVPALLQKHWDDEFKNWDAKLEDAVDLGLLRSEIQTLAASSGLQKDTLEDIYKQLTELHKSIGIGSVSFDAPGALITSLSVCP